jgi:hypothetical protein
MQHIARSHVCAGVRVWGGDGGLQEELDAAITQRSQCELALRKAKEEVCGC